MADKKSPWANSASGGSAGGGGNGGQGGFKSPPNVEYLFRKGRDSLGGMPPVKPAKAAAVIVLLALGIWALSGFYIVDAKEQGVILRFGKYTYTTGPGLHYHLPYPIEEVYTPDVMQENRIEIGFRSLEGGRRYSKVNSNYSNVSNFSDNGGTTDAYDESLMLTGDENIVDINFTVTWKIKNAPDFLFNVNNPENTIRIAAESSMRDIVAQTPIQDIMTERRDEVQLRVQDNLQKLLDSFGAGVSITAVQLKKVDPPAPVFDAFYDVQRAMADKEKSRNDAEAYRNNILPIAKGDAIKMVQDAQAYKEKVINIAQGEVSRFTALLFEYERTPHITAKRMYLESMQDILTGTNKIIIDPKLTGLLPVLPTAKKGGGQ